MLVTKFKKLCLHFSNSLLFHCFIITFITSPNKLVFILQSIKVRITISRSNRPVRPSSHVDHSPTGNSLRSSFLHGKFIVPWWTSLRHVWNVPSFSSEYRSSASCIRFYLRWRTPANFSMSKMYQLVDIRSKLW